MKINITSTVGNTVFYTCNCRKHFLKWSLPFSSVFMFDLEYVCSCLFIMMTSVIVDFCWYLSVFCLFVCLFCFASTVGHLILQLCDYCLLFYFGIICLLFYYIPKILEFCSEVASYLHSIVDGMRFRSNLEFRQTH